MRQAECVREMAMEVEERWKRWARWVVKVVRKVYSSATWGGWGWLVFWGPSKGLNGMGRGRMYYNVCF